MTRLLGAADLHLHEWPGLAPIDRLADQEHVLAQIATVARERHVDALLLAGDIFHRPVPTPAVELVFQRFLRSLGDIPVVAVTGNSSHDIENAERPCALELYESATFRLSRRPEYITEFAGVAVATLPSVPVSNYVALVGGGDRDEINAEVADHLIAVVADLATECRYTGKPSVLLGHWSVSGAAFPNGLPADAAHEPVLPLPELEDLGFDAVVLGHIHRPQLLESSIGRAAGPIFYTGSPMPLDFGEAGFEHGVWVIDFDTAPEFVPLNSRPFITLDTDAESLVSTGDLFLALAAKSVTADVDVTGAVVRVRYRATPEQQRRISAREVRQALLDVGAAKVTVQPEIVRADRARAAGLTEDLDELDAVRMYTAAQEIAWPHDEALVALTKGYLESEAVPS